MTSNLTNVSKFLSGLLRHFPDDYNLEYTSEGWFEIDDVLNCLVTKYEDVSITELKTIVDEDSKGRYEIDFGNDT